MVTENSRITLKKKKRRKAWFFSAGFALVSATGIIAAACSGGAVGDLNTLPQSRTYVAELNSVFAPTFGNYDKSNSFGGQQGRLDELTGTGLIRQQFVGRAVTEQATVEGQSKPQQVTVTPTVWHYRLELAEAVVVTPKANGTTPATPVVFTNDKHEKTPEADLKTDKGMRYKDGSVQATSEDQTSINSKKFEETLQGATKVQFVVRQNVPWVNSNGEIEKNSAGQDYTLSAHDFYVSWKRTNIYQNFSSRYANGVGGSPALDATMRTIVAASDRRPFSPTQQGYSNAYVYNLFGIDNSKFDTETDFVTKATVGGQERDAVTFDGTTDGIQAVNFMQFFSDDLTMVPAPSQYIKDHVNDPILVNQNDPANTAAIQNVKTALQNVSADSQVRQYGIYWYGQSAVNTLSVSPYFAQGFNNSNFRETWRLNTHYWDKSYVDDPTVLLTIQQLYQSAAQAPAAFNTQLFRDYIQGVTSNASYANLTQSDRATVDADAARYGLAQIPAPNVNGSITRQTPLLIPHRTTSDTATPLFNDNYMKLLFGGTVNGVKEGKVTNVLSKAAGQAAAFRSIVQAAVNWEAVTQSVDTSGNSITWLNRLAPDSFINGSDGITNQLNPTNIVRNNSEVLNTRVAWSADGTPVVGSGITPAQNDAARRSASENDSFKSASFTQLQAAMKTLLDKFFETNNSNDTTIKWVLAADDSTNATDGQVNAEKRVVETIKQLDSRLDPVYQPITGGADQFNDLWFGSFGLMTYDITGWSYDYNGIGSGLDQFSWQSDFIPYLGVLGNALKDTSNSANSWSLTAQKATPKIAKAAQDFVTFLGASDQAIKLSVPVDKWDSLPTWIVPFDPEASGENGQKGALVDVNNGGKLQSALSDWKWDTAKSRVEVRSDSEKNSFTDPFAISARFWAQYQNKTANKDLIELSKEMTNFLGVQVSRSVIVSTGTYTPALSNPRYVIPTSPAGVVNLSNYRVLPAA
ncbi:OppA family ABC transporter substrate-binding lipoprotein [[Mycoplasma] testudinis]|uniref:OppA family ABC transporter substrate-binding lipoprotein n=1 Tax=[Mycoplasma] testudinis TaxID=33924 RepID=UPI000482A672|nr:hypothetical protein [[Mycoplasma] testudinis]